MIAATASAQAAVIHEVGVVLLVMCSVLFVGVMALLAFALRPHAHGALRAGRWVVGGGVVLPVCVLSALLVYTVARTAVLTAAAGSELVITVVAHPWWWEVRYRDPAGGPDVVLANEVHLPVGHRVTIGLTASDVIHSFWVPALGGKTDALPGRISHWQVLAERAGSYRGQCAEFCGDQHARMAMHVVAHAPADFDAWLAAQARPAHEPTSEPARRGRALFVERRCTVCHTVQGLSQASGGPDLTHVGSRSHLAAGTLPMTAEALAGWIADPQAHKPGARMPAARDLPAADLQALAAYLLGLR
ncbi:MAG TPA: c-type cytochrome [Burkholderiaceae bacterium]|nr:c-type cytochrome [Burkholderiaceae bacterium]